MAKKAVMQDEDTTFVICQHTCFTAECILKKLDKLLPMQRCIEVDILRESLRVVRGVIIEKRCSTRSVA